MFVTPPPGCFATLFSRGNPWYYDTMVKLSWSNSKHDGWLLADRDYFSGTKKFGALRLALSQKMEPKMAVDGIFLAQSGTL